MCGRVMGQQLVRDADSQTPPPPSKPESALDQGAWMLHPRQARLRGSATLTKESEGGVGGEVSRGQDDWSPDP